MANNLEIWQAVCSTDPDYTKQVNVRGGYTAINPQYQLLEATKLWGPYGSTWGVQALRWNTIDDADGKRSLCLEAFFFYPIDGSNLQMDGARNGFDIAVDMPFKHGDDCHKKLLTEARSKALSMLGFNADIFLGQWEDDKYVASMRTKFGDQDELRSKALKAIALVDTKESYAKCGKHIDKLFTDTAINKTLYNELWEEMDKKQKELVDRGLI